MGLLTREQQAWISRGKLPYWVSDRRENQNLAGELNVRKYPPIPHRRRSPAEYFGMHRTSGSVPGAAELGMRYSDDSRDILHAFRPARNSLCGARRRRV